MSYSYRFEPPTDFEEPAIYGHSCYDCNEDCPGAFLIARGEHI